MAARKYAYDDDATLEACLHDQRQSRSSRPSGTVIRSGVVPINRGSIAAPPPSIPRAGAMPEFVVGERTSVFDMEVSPKPLPMIAVMAATAMFLLMTVLASFAVFR